MRGSVEFFQLGSNDIFKTDQDQFGAKFVISEGDGCGNRN
jgi:hypothetical protein